MPGRVEILTPDNVILAIPAHGLELELRPFTPKDILFDGHLPDKIAERERYLLLLERLLTPASKKLLKKKIKTKGFLKRALKLFTLFDLLDQIIPMNRESLEKVLDAILMTQGTTLKEVTASVGQGSKKN